MRLIFHLPALLRNSSALRLEQVLSLTRVCVLCQDADGDKDLLAASGDCEFIIDGCTRGNATRYINHSCDPNCIVQSVFVGKERLPRIAMVRSCTAWLGRFLVARKS